jgi:hypothetical protein
MPWGVTTHSANAIYVHVLNWKEPNLILPLKQKVSRATLLDSGAAVAVKHRADGLELTLPPTTSEQVDTVIKLQLSR